MKSQAKRWRRQQSKRHGRRAREELLLCVESCGARQTTHLVHCQGDGELHPSTQHHDVGDDDAVWTVLAGKSRMSQRFVMQRA